ncbi:AmpG family muropeptide MFS transporter [Dongia sp.]|uniref:AmpG family muropeptide MFS transporter n=1 Tax=Dongia sp. TaxID=1977262 RepID=UPI0035B3CB7B
MSVERQASWGEAFSVYFTRRQLIIFVMGFASGMPLLLTLSTLSYWLSTVGVDKTTIGLFTLVGAPYTFKFAWSPVIDQVKLPILGRLGRRKSWLLFIQILLAAAIFAMGQSDPVANAGLTALLAIIVAFFSASQDIVIDAYRIEILGPEEQGAGAGTTQVGYRIGLLLAGAGATALSDYVGWPTIFAILAAAMLLCAFSTLFVPEPKTASVRTHKSYADLINDAVIKPFADFIGRKGWVIILLFILFYKYGDAFGGAMANPFYHELGFTGTEIAAVSKLFGIIASLVGGVVGGVIVARFGLFRTLLVGGILQAVTNLLFSYLATKGADIFWLAIAISADNVAGGIASAALVAYLSGLCNIAFTATQYALFSSFMAQGRTILSAGSGWMADHTDWASFWALTTLMAIPGILLLLWISRLYPHGLVAKEK